MAPSTLHVRTLRAQQRTALRKFAVVLQVTGFVCVVFQDDVGLGILVVTQADEDDVPVVDPHLWFAVPRVLARRGTREAHARHMRGTREAGDAARARLERVMPPGPVGGTCKQGGRWRPPARKQNRPQGWRWR